MGQAGDVIDKINNTLNPYKAISDRVEKYDNLSEKINECNKIANSKCESNSDLQCWAKKENWRLENCTKKGLNATGQAVTDDYDTTFFGNPYDKTDTNITTVDDNVTFDTPGFGEKNKDETDITFDGGATYDTCPSYDDLVNHGTPEYTVENYEDQLYNCIYENEDIENTTYHTDYDDLLKMRNKK
jgi:hypothetical protein